MTRLHRFLHEVWNDTVDRPEEVARLKWEIPELAHATDQQVEKLYRQFSESYWSAGWIKVGDGSISEFKIFLSEEI